jgi:hypothetical protein
MAEHLKYDPITGHLLYRPTGGHLVHTCPDDGGGEPPDEDCNNCCDTYVIIFESAGGGPTKTVTLGRVPDTCDWAGQDELESVNASITLVGGNWVLIYNDGSTLTTWTMPANICPSEDTGDWTYSDTDGFPIDPHIEIVSITAEDCPA